MHCTVCGRRSCDVAAKQLFKACTAEQAQLCTPPQSPAVARSKLHLYVQIVQWWGGGEVQRESWVLASDIKCRQHAVCSTGCPNLTFSAEQMWYLWHLVAVLYWILCTYLYSQSEYFILKSLFVINHPLRLFISVNFHKMKFHRQENEKRL